jgi:hypothetical protein
MYEVCSIVFCKDSAFLRNKKFAPVFYCIQAGGKTVNGLQSSVGYAVCGVCVFQFTGVQSWSVGWLVEVFVARNPLKLS